MNRPESIASSWLEPQIGFQLAHEQFKVPELVELGIAADQAGFDLLAVSDHFQPWQENEGHSGQAWITMTAIGQKTKRIRMGTTVTCPTFRYNPAVVAEAFASLSLLMRGRVFLGVGSGEALNEQAATGSWPKWTERSERLVEATDIIRKLWNGQPVDHSGPYYKVKARLYDPPAQSIPLLMAGNGPKAMRRCGQYADGLITDPKTWKEYKAEFQKGASDAGKDPARMPIFIEQYVVVGGKSELNEAAELWRFGPKAWKPYFNIRDPKTIQERAEAEVPARKSDGRLAGGYRSGGSCEGARGSVQERCHRGPYPFWPTRSEKSNRFLREGSVAPLAGDFQKSRLIGLSRMISKSSDPAILFDLDGTLVDSTTAMLPRGPPP